MSLVGVVGPGLMGIGIAQVAAGAGYDVTLLGRNELASRSGLARFQGHIERQVSRGRLGRKDADTILARVWAADEVEQLADCAVVIETVYEQRELKASVLRLVESAIGPETVIATNTSGLPVSGLAQHLREPGRFVGLHFFSPVERMKLVEVVPGALTCDRALREALAFVRSLNLSPVIVRDSPGFFTSRVFCAYLDEALAMVGKGVDPELIDAAALSGGRAMGPLAVLDNTSLTLSLQQSRQAVLDGLPEPRCRLIGAPVLERMIAAGRPGRGGGGGFYETDPSARRFWSGLSQLFPLLKTQPSPADVLERLLFAEAMEALRALEEGVIKSADDADLASVLGLGFPRGGVLQWVESQGLSYFVGRSRELARQHGARFEPSIWLTSIANNRGDLRTAPFKAEALRRESPLT